MHKSKDQKRYEAIVRQLKHLKQIYKENKNIIKQSQVTGIYQTLAVFDIGNWAGDSDFESKVITLCKKLTGKVKT